MDKGKWIELPCFEKGIYVSEQKIKVKKLKYWTDGGWKNIHITNNLRIDNKRENPIAFNSFIFFPNITNAFYIPPLWLFADLFSMVNNINQKLYEAKIKKQIHINTLPRGIQGAGMISLWLFECPCEECWSTKYLTPVLVSPNPTDVDYLKDNHFVKLLDKWVEIEKSLPIIIEDLKKMEEEQKNGDFRQWTCLHKVSNHCIEKKQLKKEED